MQLSWRESNISGFETVSYTGVLFDINTGSFFSMGFDSSIFRKDPVTL